jgi:hypothetical protein
MNSLAKYMQNRLDVGKNMENFDDLEEFPELQVVHD